MYYQMPAEANQVHRLRFIVFTPLTQNFRKYPAPRRALHFVNRAVLSSRTPLPKQIYHPLRHK